MLQKFNKDRILSLERESGLNFVDICCISVSIKCIFVVEFLMFVFYVNVPNNLTFYDWGVAD